MKRILLFSIVVLFALFSCVHLKQPQQDTVNRMLGFEAGVLVAKEYPGIVDELISIIETVSATDKIHNMVHKVILDRVSKTNLVRLEAFLSLIEIEGPKITESQKIAIKGFLEALKLE